MSFKQVLFRPLSSGSPCLGIVRRTSGLVGDICQTRQATGQFGESTIGEKLVYGSGFTHSPSGDQWYSPEQRAATRAEGAQDLTLRLTNGLCGVSVDDRWGEARRLGDNLLKTET